MESGEHCPEKAAPISVGASNFLIALVFFIIKQTSRACKHEYFLHLNFEPELSCVALNVSSSGFLFFSVLMIDFFVVFLFDVRFCLCNTSG